MSEEMQAVVEIETEEQLRARLDQEAQIIELEEQIESLKNKLAILEQLHGEACQGWSKWQQESERYLAELRFIYGLADGALALYLKRGQLEGFLRAIRRSAGSKLPEFDEIPF